MSEPSATGIPRPNRTTIPRPVDRAEWLRVRAPYFNASATSVLFSRHPFMSATEYAVVKLTGEEQTETRPMRRGRHLESGVAEWYAAEAGIILTEPDVLFVAERVMATVDRFTVTGPDTLIEVKTTNGYVDEPEPYWLDQVQAQMYASGFDRARIVWVDSSMSLKEYDVDADVEMQAKIGELAERFMAAIDMQIIPDWVGGELTAALVSRLYPDPAGTVEVEADAAAAVAEYRHWRDVRNEAEQRMLECKDFVAAALGEHEVGTWAGEKIVTFKRIADSVELNRKRLEADHPDLVKQYLETRPGGRRFLPAG